jgi:predicted TIM-barrel fold metal-dependent hydrolase
MSEPSRCTRRSSLKGLGLLAVGTVLGGPAAAATIPLSAEKADTPGDVRQKITAKVEATSFIDTHEHLCEEQVRLSGQAPDDWSMLLAGYLGSDLLTAGMPPGDHKKFFSKGLTPEEKWALLEPFWPAVKTTGYGQAARISIRRLYGVDNLSRESVGRVQQGYEAIRRPGYYRHVLCDLARIESCQVNSLTAPFNESALPTLLMQDLSLIPMFVGPDLKGLSRPTGVTVSGLSSWHLVIDWWFDKYSRYAVAVKSQNAYARDIDYERVPAEAVEATFRKRLAGQPLIPEEQKRLEDHLFWYAVDRATRDRLPVKLHTGYYAGQNGMPLSRLIHNAGSACELCRRAPDTTFVFMHTCYPYYEELIAVAKQWTNACVDMCWAWIINPVAAKDFLKKYLVTAPTNKILTFGGDYLNVEQVLGHAVIARRGIALALSELVEEGWLSLDDALGLVDPIMHGNARRLFRLEEKQRALQSVPWAKEHVG